MTVSSTLFSGTALGFGGLSNEKELVAACPQEFKKTNAWSYAAMMYLCGEVNASAWTLKSPDDAERQRQRHCFRGLLSGFDLSHEDKAAVAGWMLSEMLSEVPAV